MYLFSTIIAIIRACACWALLVVTLTNTVHLIYIYIYIYIYYQRVTQICANINQLQYPNRKNSMNYTLITWWNLMLPASRLFVQLCVQSNKTDKIKAVRYWYFERESYRWPVDYSNKEPVIQNDVMKLTWCKINLPSVSPLMCTNEIYLPRDTPISWQVFEKLRNIKPSF